MGTKRNWSSEAYKKARAESQQIEGLMLSIVNLFADGSFVFRSRTRRMAGVQTKTDRLKRIRQAMVAMPLEPGTSDPAVA